jgi:hypothetical protein
MGYRSPVRSIRALVFPTSLSSKWIANRARLRLASASVVGAHLCGSNGIDGALARWVLTAPWRLAIVARMISPTPKPVAVCSGCGTFTNARSAIGRPCGLRVALRRRRCEGVYLVASAPDDWVACERCREKGGGTARRCSRCRGTGWQYVRAASRRE